jgi:hypothetical protein
VPLFRSRFPAAFRLPALASRAVLSRWGVRLPHGQPTGREPGPPRGFHVPHERDTTGVGAPLTPRRRCPPGRSDLYQPAPADSQRPALHPAAPFHRRGLGSRGIIGGSLAFTRPVFPWPVAPGWNENPRAVTLSFAPRRCQRRTSERGRAIRTRTRNYTFITEPPMVSSLHSCDLVSHNNPPSGRGRLDQRPRPADRGSTPRR